MKQELKEELQAELKEELKQEFQAELNDEKNNELNAQIENIYSSSAGNSTPLQTIRDETISHVIGVIQNMIDAKQVEIKDATKIIRMLKENIYFGGYNE